MTRTDLQLYSKSDLETARTKGQMVGWAQGAGSLIAVGLVLKLLGWIPAILVFGGVGNVIYRLFDKPAPPGT